MDRKVFISLLLALAVVGLVWLTFAIFHPFLLAMLWAAAIASVSYAPYLRLKAWMGGRRNLSATVMSIVVLVVIVGPFGTMAVALFEDATGLVANLHPENLEARLKNVISHRWVESTLDWVYGTAGPEFERRDALAAVAKKVSGPIARWTADALTFLLSLLVGLGTVMVSIFFFFRDGPDLVQVVRELIPLREADREAVIGDIHGATVAAIRGGFLTALAQGALGFIILFILNVDNALLWTAAMALASLIPLVGTALIWLPIALVMVADGQVGRAVALVGYGVLVIGMADNFLRPMLVGQHMEAHPLLLFFGTMGGIMMFGFGGIILGPVAVALLGVTTRIFRREVRGMAPDSQAA